MQILFILKKLTCIVIYKEILINTDKIIIYIEDRYGFCTPDSIWTSSEDCMLEPLKNIITYWDKNVECMQEIRS